MKALPSALTSVIVGLACLLLATSVARCQIDTNGIVSVNTVDGSTIGVYFDQPVDPGSASVAANYLIYDKGFSGSINVTSAVLQSDGQSVALSLDSPVGEFYAVAVSNVFNSFGDTIIDANATGYPSDFTTASIGTVSDPDPVGSVFVALRHTFNVTASGSGIGGTNDHCQFVYQQIIGDFDLSVQVTNLDTSDPNAVAGLLARDTLDAGSPMALVSFTSGTGAGLIQTSGRLATNASATTFAFVSGASPYPWLRINRTGNSLTAYYGTNGVNWVAISNSFPLVLNSNLYVGAALTSGANGLTTTASFTSFGVSGAKPGDAIIPSVSARIFQTNTLVISWPVTPDDFTVLIATNLYYPTNIISGGSSTNAPIAWALVGLPVQDSNLTGTNAAMPGLGRYMLLPLNIFGTPTPIFVRLEKVVRVIPDPGLVLTPGMIFSTTTYLVSSQSNSSICSTAGSVSVVKSTEVSTTPNYPIVCLAGTNYTFTTLPNAPSPVVPLQILTSAAIGGGPICGSPTAVEGTTEYGVTFTPVTTPTYVTFVAAATTPVSARNPIQVQLNFNPVFGAEGVIH